MLKIGIEGVEELRAKLSKVDLHRVDSTWIKRGTLTLQGEGRKEAPVGIYKHRAGGNLRDNIIYENFAKIGFVKATAPYAFFVHEGTRYIRTPNKFFTRAVDNKRDDIIQEYRDILQRKIYSIGLSN